ncbi:MAG: helix-turn-helix domain-containing protein [Lachnospiraceae bacterium]|nr:helix-turn-helix domain-containing protein [Lachnospiraceae bacterium]
MITTQVIQKCIDDLKNISKVDLQIYDTEGAFVAKTQDAPGADTEILAQFTGSAADSQSVGGMQYLKIYEEGEPAYVLICEEGAESYMIGRIAAAQIQSLSVAYREKYDRNNFFQNLILDNMLLVDIYNRAKKLHIETSGPRVVMLLEFPQGKESTASDYLKGMFLEQTGDYVTAVDENSQIVIKQLSDKDGYEEVNELAQSIVSMMNTEAMLNVKLASGTIVQELKDVSKSYKEAKMAMEVGKIFYEEKDVVSYHALGIGRLIYQLPPNLCRIFIEEIFGGDMPEEIDEETLITIETFLENNLNVSETSRQLYVHRNTLLYRLEKLEKLTGLDIRIFEDALTLKIALMVVKRAEYESRMMGE